MFAQTPRRAATTRHPASPAALNTLALAAGLAMAAAPPSAVAQAAPSPDAAASAPAAPTTPATLPVVRATASKEQAGGPVDGYAARRSNTATKTDTPLNEVPQAITVITAEQIKDQNAQTMQEVLRYTAGVRSETYGLDNRGDWFTLRGGSEGSTLLDGLRLPLTGWYGVVRNEPYAFERIEVLRGPASVIAGQNGPGGVVNLVSKRPQAEPLREIAVQFGNDSHKEIAADLTGPLNADGTLLYRVVGLAKDSGTQIDHAFDKRYFIAPSLTWQPSGATRVTAYAELQRDETGATNAFFPIEGTLNDAPNGRIPTDTFIGEPDWDSYGGRRTRLGYEMEQRLSDRWSLRHHLRYDRLGGRMRNLYAAWWEGFVDANGDPAPDTGTSLGRYWFFTNDSGRVVNSDLLLEGKLRFGSTQHTLLAGVDAVNARSSQQYWEDRATPLDVYNPVYGSFPLPELTDVPATISRVRQLGLLLQDQIKFDERWSVVLGLRHDRARTSTEYDGASSGTRDAATSKNFGLVYLGGGGWSPYLSYSESFEPVGDSDFAGKPFKPKRGKQVEAGLKWAPAGQRMTAAAALYQLKETNRLTADPDPEHVGFSIQRGEVTVKGLELELAANLPAWDLIANYTYMDARQTRASSEDLRYLDQQLGSVPRNSAAVWAVHKFGAYGLPGLRAGLGVRYVGETTDGVKGGSVLPSTTLFDLLLAYDTGPWRLALNVANATDEPYIATCLERGDCWFGTRRKAIVSAAYRW